MVKQIIGALVVVMMGVLAPLGTPALTAARTAAVDVLYQADWSTGLAGWKVYPGFAVSHGALTFDGRTDAGAFAPFKLNDRQDVAVEATMRIGRPSGTTAYGSAGYYLFARRSSVHQRSGMFAGYDATSGEKSTKNVSDLYWLSPGRPYYVPGAALQPDTAVHTYRLEVQGTAYRLLVDGRVFVPWTIVKLQDAADEVGLTFTYFPATVTAFRVLALPAATVATARDTSPLLARALPQPAGSLPPTRATFRDNALYATDSKIDPATLQRTGRIFGYIEAFQSNATYVEQSLNMHRDPAGARAALNFFAGRIRGSANHPQAYRDLTSAAAGIGDARFAFSYQYTYQGSLDYVDKVLFQRGDYYEGITVDSLNKGVAQTALALAQQADALAQR